MSWKKAFRGWIGFYVLLACVGCHQKRPVSSLTLGQTTPAELQQIKGQPVEVEKSSIRENTQIFHYDHNENFQIEDGKVVARFSEPAPDERALQTWRHRWAGLNPSYVPLEDTQDAHGQMKYMLRAESLKKAVIYDPEKDRVIRVVEYGN